MDVSQRFLRSSAVLTVLFHMVLAARLKLDGQNLRSVHFDGIIVEPIPKFCHLTPCQWVINKLRQIAFCHVQTIAITICIQAAQDIRYIELGELDTLLNGPADRRTRFPQLQRLLLNIEQPIGMGLELVDGILGIQLPQTLARGIVIVS